MGTRDAANAIQPARRRKPAAWWSLVGGAVGVAVWAAPAAAQAPRPAAQPVTPGFPLPRGAAVPPASPAQPMPVQQPFPAAPAVGQPPILVPGQLGIPAAEVTLPTPRPLDPPPVGATVQSPARSAALPRMPGEPAPLGSTPRPTAATQAKFDKYFQQFVDPEMSLDLIQGRTRLLVLKRMPKRIQVADDSIVENGIIQPGQISLLGRNIGVTVMTFWFDDPDQAGKEEILTYHVRVVPDPEVKDRIEKHYKALADQINQTFHDSFVCLNVVGDKVVATGHAHDIAESTQIIQIISSNPYYGAGGYGGRGYGGYGGGGPIIGRTPVDRPKPEASNTETTPKSNVDATAPGQSNYILEGVPTVVNRIRIPGEQQVALKVTIAEINRAAARSIGLNFSITNNQGRTVAANNTGSILTGGLTRTTFGGYGVSGGFGGLGNYISPIPGIVTGTGGYNNLPAVLDNGQVALAINALRELNYAKTLAEPNLTALHGQQASFHAGGQYPVPVIAGGGVGYGLQGVNFIPYGVSLTFTPFITDRDRVRLVVGGQISGLDAVNGSLIGNNSINGLNSRSFSTTVELREGQTIAIAGLIQNNLSAQASRVPLFGDLPIIGRLAAFDRITAGEQELVVLITPELVHPLDKCEELPLPGSDLFEPSDLEFYLLGRLESRRGQDFRSPVMTDWQRLKTYRMTEKMYLSGPSGYSIDP